MTLILATIVGDDAVMCADTRIGWEDPPGVTHTGTATKMSLKGGCIVGTYGAGPPGVHARIGALSDLLNGAWQVANAIRQEFWPGGPGAPDMGSLIAGFDGANGVILRVERGGPPSQGLPHDVHAGGAAVPAGSNLQPAATVDAMLQQMLVVQRAVTAVNANVGPPYDCVVLRRVS